MHHGIMKKLSNASALLILFTAQIRKAIDSLAIIMFVGLQTKKEGMLFHIPSHSKKVVSTSY